MNYLRITGYDKEKNISFIMDSFGMFKEIWEFTSYITNKGMYILELGDDKKFLDGNLEKIDESKEKVVLRAVMKGKPEKTNLNLNGKKYKAIKVADKIYIPNKKIYSLNTII